MNYLIHFVRKSGLLISSVVGNSYGSRCLSLYAFHQPARLAQRAIKILFVISSTKKKTVLPYDVFLTGVICDGSAVSFVSGSAYQWWVQDFGLWVIPVQIEGYREKRGTLNVLRILANVIQTPISPRFPLIQCLLLKFSPDIVEEALIVGEL